MSLWIILAVTAYLLYALNGIADKFLLTKAVRKPAVYAFYIGITGPLTWLLIPFGLKFLSFANLLVAIAGGVAFVLALFYLYKAERETSISRVLPVQGGLVPLFTLLMAYLLLGERLLTNQFIAFILMVVGAVIISFRKESRGWHTKALGKMIIAAFLFALSLTLTKYIFDLTNFVSGLVWTRLGFLLASVSFLISKDTRKAVFNAPKTTSSGNKLLYYGARVSGGAAGLMQNYAIAIGSVTIVNAMQGTQFMFLLILTSILSVKFPNILKEKINSQTILQKVLAIILISAGLIFLAL